MGGGVDRIIEVDITANAALIPDVLRPGGTAIVYGVPIRLMQTHTICRDALTRHFTHTIYP